MAKVKIQGHASGTGVFTLTSPNSNTDRTITLPDADVTLGTDATKMPLSGGAFTGAVTTNSTIDGRDVAADGVLATNALPKAGGAMTGTTTHADNVKSTWGSGNDLEIYHDGTHGYIAEAVNSNSSGLRFKVAGENGIHINAEGSVDLYHDNNKKLETTATGITVTGAIAGATNLGLTSKYVAFTRNAASGAGTQAITGVGFQPTAVLFLVSIGGAGMASVGFEDSNREGDSLADRQLMTANDWDVEVWNGDPINMVYASTVNYGANISSYDSDGFTLTWATRGSPSGTVKLRALCLK